MFWLDVPKTTTPHPLFHLIELSHLSSGLYRTVAQQQERISCDSLLIAIRQLLGFEIDNLIYALR
jgi:hypothetical protein